MSDLFWPGDERAGDLMSEAAFLAAMVQVEEAWLSGLVASGIAPDAAKADLAGLVEPGDTESLALQSEAAGNPVIPLVSLLRKRIGGSNPEAGRWLHCGLTSQDVVDTGLMLCCRDVLDRVTLDIGHQIEALVELVHRHRSTLMAGRTLTQHAVPITFGLKASGWLTGILDAAEAVGNARAGLAGQAGGAAGTSAATVELARSAGLDDPVSAATGLADRFADDLGLAARPAWHTSRRPVTAVGDALVTATDAWAGSPPTSSRSPARRSGSWPNPTSPDGADPPRCPRSRTPCCPS